MPRMTNLEGAMLSEYFLLQRISTGSSTDIYRARQQSEGQYEVAVKVFYATHAPRTSFRENFMSEAEKIGQFEHPNILPLLEFGEGEDMLYVVTPYIATGTLDDLLKLVGGKFSASQAMPVIQQLCAALQYAHQRHVIHGNLKQSNVFVAADGRILLADFGIARSYDDSQQSLMRASQGSAEYIAPEQSLGVLKRASDVYALGALLFRLLTGQPLFTGQTPMEVLLKHVRQAPPSARTFVPTISDAVDNVLQQALQKRPEDRFASVEEFSHAFGAAVSVAPVASPFASSVLKPSSFSNPSPPFALMPSTADPNTPLPVGAYRHETPSPFTTMPSVAQSQATTWSRPQSQPRVTRQLSPAMPFEVELPVNRPGVGNADKVGSMQPKSLQSGDGSSQTGFEPGVVIGKQHFWSAEPVEWSPIGSTQGNASLAHDIPLDAAAYLTGPSGVKPSRRATAVLAPQSTPDTSIVPSLETDLDEQESVAGKDESVFAQQLRKWLPVIVVILLLLGLLGAFLSSFFFPIS